MHILAVLKLQVQFLQISTILVFLQLNQMVYPLNIAFLEIKFQPMLMEELYIDKTVVLCQY